MSDRQPMRVITWDEWEEMTRNLPPATRDDVSVTNDGRRLDTKEKVVEFFAGCGSRRV